MLTELPSVGVGLLHFGSRSSLSWQCSDAPKAIMHVYFALETLRCLRQRLEQLPALDGDGLMASTWAERWTGSLTSLMPIANRLFSETCFRIVMRQQFWLCLSGLRELGFQAPGQYVDGSAAACSLTATRRQHPE